MCAALLPNILRMRTNKYGAYVPELINEQAQDWGQLSLTVCPFADNDNNEDVLAERLFAHQQGIKHRPETGYYLKCLVGHVSDEQDRLAATSGGIITWLAKQMLESGDIQAVACVGKSRNDENLFEFELISNSEELERCKKSRYYPVEVSGIIDKIKKIEGKVLFIGLPCFIKALRLATSYDSLLNSKIVCTIGLFCGHLKTKNYAAYLARCCGVHEQNIETVNFRKKIPDKPANSYAFEVFTRNGGRDNQREI